MTLTQIYGWTEEETAQAQALAKQAEVYCANFNISDYYPYPFKTLEHVIELGNALAETNAWVAGAMFDASPEILKYGLSTLERVIELSKSLAKTNAWAAGEMFDASPEILKRYSENGVLEHLEHVIELGKGIAEIDGMAAGEMFEASPRILNITGKYSTSLLDYLQRRMPLFITETLCNINFKKLGGLRTYLDKTNFGAELGKKKVKSLLDLIFSADLYNKIDLEATFSTLDTNDLKKAAEGIDIQLTADVEQRYKIKTQSETLRKFVSYVPYLNDGGTFASLLKGVLENRSYINGFETEIVAKKEIALESIRDELTRSTELYNTITGKNVILTPQADIMGYARFAQSLHDDLKDWKSENVSSKDVKELEPNLKRLADLRNGKEKAYSLCFAPNNFADQLEALAKIPSCLSPGGSKFGHSKHYLSDTINQDTGIYFAVIKDSQGKIVGRTTIAQGYDSDGQKGVARVSRVYPESLGISDIAFDSALEQYAGSISARTLANGEMVVPDIGEKAYDDFMSQGTGTDAINISRGN